VLFLYECIFQKLYSIDSVESFLLILNFKFIIISSFFTITMKFQPLFKLFLKSRCNRHFVFVKFALRVRWVQVRCRTLETSLEESAGLFASGIT